MKTEIAYILDRSGSMCSCWGDAWGGLEQFIEDQKQVEGECKFTLVGFDDKYDVFINAADIQEVKDIRRFGPRGMTALYDAIGKTVTSIGERLANTPEDERPEKVIVVIMTDGYENDSHEYNHAQIKDMITHQEEKYSWEFIFMGAGVDAVTMGADLGAKIQNTLNVQKTAQGFADASLYATASTRSYREK